MSVFRIVEGTVNTRPSGPLGDASFDGAQVVAADVLFDLGGVRKDIHIECNRPIGIKFNSAANAVINLPAGVWDVTEEFANKVYATFTVPTNFVMFANG